MKKLSVILFTLSVVFIADILPARAADVVLKGTVHDTQNHSYIEVPFQVPAGVERLTVSFSYTGKKDHAVLDLGMEDPDRFRGWSGGNKMQFSIGIADATPMCSTPQAIYSCWETLFI